MKPAFDTFVAPSRKHADIIIPWGGCAALHAPCSQRAALAALYCTSSCLVLAGVSCMTVSALCRLQHATCMQMLGQHLCQQAELQ